MRHKGKPKTRKPFGMMNDSRHIIQHTPYVWCDCSKPEEPITKIFSVALYDCTRVIYYFSPSGTVYKERNREWKYKLFTLSTGIETRDSRVAAKDRELLL